MLMTTEQERFIDTVATLDLPDLYQVGAFLISQGITESKAGNGWYPACCPIAQYLHKCGFVDAWVTNDTAVPPRNYEDEFPVRLPPAAIAFINWHDKFVTTAIYE
jgi:hypothetical protein